MSIVGNSIGGMSLFHPGPKSPGRVGGPQVGKPAPTPASTTLSKPGNYYANSLAKTIQANTGPLQYAGRPDTGGAPQMPQQPMQQAPQVNFDPQDPRNAALAGYGNFTGSGETGQYGNGFGSVPAAPTGMQPPVPNHDAMDKQRIAGGASVVPPSTGNNSTMGGNAARGWAG